MTPPTSAAGIAWLPWGEAAFARARTENRPMLLTLTASWCPSSADMDRTSFAGERIVELVTSLLAERAEDVLRYLQTWLADPVDGGWAASERGADTTGEPGPLDRTHDALATREARR